MKNPVRLFVLGIALAGLAGCKNTMTSGILERQEGKAAMYETAALNNADAACHLSTLADQAYWEGDYQRWEQLKSAANKVAPQVRSSLNMSHHARRGYQR